MAIMRRVAEHLPGGESMRLPAGATLVAMPNAIINDIRAAIAADARKRNAEDVQDEN
jgi:hypothetical protein